MNRLSFVIAVAISLMATTVKAQNFSALDGFAYGEQDAPRGYESKSP